MFWPFNHYPGSDYETFNYDWIIGKLKELKNSVTAAKASEDAAADSADNAASSAAAASESAEHAATSELNAANDAAGVNSLRNQIITNTSRIDVIETEAATDPNAELLDVRVDSIGYTFTTAGNATRFTDSVVKDSILIPYTDKEHKTGSGTGGTRIIHGAGLKAGKKYVLELDIEDLAIYNTMYIRSCNDRYDAANTTVETFTTIAGPQNYHAQTLKYELVPTLDANYLYLYINLGSTTQTYNFDVQLFEYEQLSAWLPSFGGKWTRNRLTMHSNGTSVHREYMAYEFKAGNEYTITMHIDKLVTEDWPSNLFILGTTLTNATTNRIDLVFVEKNPNTSVYHDLSGTVYQQTFTATADADYLYFYTAIKYQESPVILNNICFDIVENALVAPMSAIGRNAVTKYDNYYYGMLETNNNTYGIDAIPVINSTGYYAQGMAIYNDKIFAARNTGIIEVYSLSGTYLTTFNLASAGNTNHAGTINFSNIFYDDADTYPLLYCKIGDGPDSFTCSVERIQESGGQFTATQVQTITLDQSQFAANGLVPCWGWPAFIPGNNLLYVYSAIYRTNGSQAQHYNDNRYLITAFPIPDVSQAAVTITATDVYKQTIAPYTADFAQGATINGNSLIALYGDGSTYDTKIIQYNLWSGDITAVIDKPFTTEPEDCCVYNNNLYVQDASNNIWKIQIE